MRLPLARLPLVLLPLDDRPVNLDDVALLAREHGVSLLLPPRPLLGHRTRPGDADALASWLMEVAPDAGGFVVSLDQLLYGGLIASRNAAAMGTSSAGASSAGASSASASSAGASSAGASSAGASSAGASSASADSVDEATARRRLATLAALRTARPDAPILAFLVLPRTTSTVSTSADLAAWSQGVDAGAPPPKRRRNLTLALAAVESLGAGHLDWLSILQEDTSAAACPRTEHEALLRAVAAAGLDDRCVITTGADEAGRVLLARLAGPTDLTVTVRYASAGGADRVALYEDRSLRATLAGQLRALGARELDAGERSPGPGDRPLGPGDRPLGPGGRPLDGGGTTPDAVIELWVHAPDQTGVDLCMRSVSATGAGTVPGSPPAAPETAPFLDALRARLREPGRPVIVLADTAHANGADPTLLSMLDDELVADLDGFAAWNTAANTLGCALAQGALSASAASPRDSLSPRPFVLRRLADDGLYQTRVRPALAAAAATMGADPWCLGGPARLELERQATELFARERTRVDGLTLSAPTGSAPAGSLHISPFAVELPWERLFEARLRPLVEAPRRSMPRRDDVDVVVAGGGISGVTTALAAARLGVRVTLVEASAMLGGSATRNLVTPWMGFHSLPGVPAVAGLAQEIVAALVAAGASPGHVTDPIGTAVTLTPFEPAGLRMVLARLLRDAGVELLLHTRVIDAASPLGHTVQARPEGDVGSTSAHIPARTTLVLHGPGGHTALAAPVVVDATGDAAVAHLLGAPTVHGRPGDGAAQPATLMVRLAGVDGEAVARAQAANPEDFVLSDEARGLLPQMTWPAVAGFFSIVSRAQTDGLMGDFRDRVLGFALPGGDWVLNMTRVTGLTTLEGGDRTAAELRGLQQAEQVVDFLRRRVPGFAAARVVELGSALGVRETRHLVGRSTLTADDILAGRRHETSVARGCFPLDLHAPDGSGMSIRHAPPGSWYGIPWGCLLPADGPPGLVVTGRAISATHEASASARLAPTCLALGQAAGTGAALAVRQSCAPADLDPAELRGRLVAAGALV